ncbi:carbohydrate ABC transporter permease [Agilicoccus flavus]|uniref:carbohydrate ABC transporter permease n=1 Tax=Agilicoccus flavus TaxID=2775968 RepID=UPI001CF7049E|nr:sugar ABC transporter permease [Agilicoccus flavus]
MNKPPSLIVMFGLLVVPLYRTIEWSLERVNYGEAGTFVGFDNYAFALGDPRFHSTLWFTTGLTIVSAVVIVVLAYVLAIFVDGLRRARPLVLGIMLIPYVLPHVVGSAAYSWLFDPNFGGPAALVISRLTGQEILWFTDAWPNRLLVMSNIVWSMLPFAMLMILAGLQGVSEDLREAADLDGVNAWQRHWHVIIPSIRGVMGFVGLILTMDIFRVFDNLIPLSPAAVQIGNESMMLYIYNIAFREGSPQLGLGSAVSVLTILVILVLLYPSIRGILREASGRD